jgi:hypothetical protein
MWGETTEQSLSRMKLALGRLQATTSALFWFHPKSRPDLPDLSRRILTDFQGTHFPL